MSKVAEKGRARFRIPEGGINPCLFPIRASSIQSRGGSNHIFRPKGTIRVDANQPYRSNANSAARFTALSNRRLRPQTTRLLAATIKRGPRFEEVSTRGNSRPILPSSSSSSFPSRFHSRHVCSEKNCASLSLSLSLFSKGNPALVSSWSLDKSRLTNERSFRAWRGGGYFAWKSVTNSSVALAPFFSLSPAGLRVTSRILVIRLWTRSFVTRQRFDSFSFSIAATRLEKLGRIHDDAVRQPHRRSLVFSSSLN